MNLNTVIKILMWSVLALNMNDVVECACVDDSTTTVAAPVCDMFTSPKIWTPCSTNADCGDGPNFVCWPFDIKRCVCSDYSITHPRFDGPCGSACPDILQCAFGGCYLRQGEYCALDDPCASNSCNTSTKRCD